MSNGTDDWDSLEDVDSPQLNPATLDEAVATGGRIVLNEDDDDMLGGSFAPDLTATTVDLQSGDIAERPGMSLPSQPALISQLSGAVPLLLLAKSHQISSQLPAVARIATRVTGGRIGVGVAVRLLGHTPAAAASFLNHFTSSPVRIADPDLYRAPASGSPEAGVSARVGERHPWLIDAPEASSMASTSWIREVLDRQVQAGATILLSATGWVNATNAAQQLACAMQRVCASRLEVGSATMFVNLTLDGTWLSDPALRAVLLQEIIESPERYWYLRVRWPIVRPRYGQLRDVATLDGYKELAETAALEDKVLILPNSGLTGWIATSLGATGFSTGPGWPEQAYAAPQIMASRPGQPKPPPTLRYFERTVLNIVDHATHSAMIGSAEYLQCQCRYCRAIGASTQNSARWNKESAAMHYLLRCARLMDLISSGNRRGKALEEVQRARQFVSQIASTPASPTGNSSPLHLSEWERLLT